MDDHQEIRSGRIMPRHLGRMTRSFLHEFILSQ